LSFFSLFNMIGGVPPPAIGLRACHGMWSETAKKAVVTQLPLGNPVLTLTGQLFVSAAFMVQKFRTTFVPPTGEAIAPGRSPAIACGRSPATACGRSPPHFTNYSISFSCNSQESMV
jgi:hypothetical protein